MHISAGQYYQIDLLLESGLTETAFFVVELQVFRAYTVGTEADPIDGTDDRFQIKWLSGRFKGRTQWVTKTPIMEKCTQLSNDTLTWFLLSV